MNSNMQQNSAYSSLSAITQHRVLRNTYLLLAISLLPTIAGAWLGVQFNFGNILSGSPFLGFVAFLAIAFVFFYAIERNKNSGLGVVLLLAFTFFMGLMLSRLLQYTLGYSNGAQLIMLAFGGTAVVFGVMSTIAIVSKRDFSNLGKWLFAGVIVLILAALGNIFLQLPGLTVTISVIATAIFSAYILFDVQQVVNGGETNYISATLAIYLDIYNVFTNLLSLLGIVGGDNRN